MKIIGGKLKGRNFFMPAGIEPTQNVVRKAVFDIIGQDQEGVRFLELFAGSGAVGLEAISRRAQEVVFVERDPKCVDVIHENLKRLGLADGPFLPQPSVSYEVIMNDAYASVKLLASRKRKFDVVFADPPYDLGHPKKLLKTLSAHDILHPNCLVIIQYSRREHHPIEDNRFKLIKQKNYGLSNLAVFEG